MIEYHLLDGRCNVECRKFATDDASPIK